MRCKIGWTCSHPIWCECGVTRFAEVRLEVRLEDEVHKRYLVVCTRLVTSDILPRTHRTFNATDARSFRCSWRNARAFPSCYGHFRPERRRSPFFLTSLFFFPSIIIALARVLRKLWCQGTGQLTTGKGDGIKGSSSTWCKGRIRFICLCLPRCTRKYSRVRVNWEKCKYHN